jgi:hypothetical protein
MSTGQVPIVDDKMLYGWYSDENHKYNTLIWQFPAAIVGLNILAFDKFGFGSSPLIYMALINFVLLYCVAKHVYHQRCFTSALERIAKRFRESGADGVVCFPAIALFKLKAGWVLVGFLFLADFVLAGVGVWKAFA